MDDPYTPTHEDYMTYKLLLADKVSNAAIVAHFGPRKAAALSLKYQAALAAYACPMPCPKCGGKRGCTCTSSERIDASGDGHTS